MSLEALLDESLYRGAFAALDALQLPADVRLVMFVDDLDRWVDGERPALPCWRDR
jgi:hypothetical protein